MEITYNVNYSDKVVEALGENAVAILEEVTEGAVQFFLENPDDEVLDAEVKFNKNGDKVTIVICKETITELYALTKEEFDSIQILSTEQYKEKFKTEDCSGKKCNPECCCECTDEGGTE